MCVCVRAQITLSRIRRNQHISARTRKASRQHLRPQSSHHLHTAQHTAQHISGRGETQHETDTAARPTRVTECTMAAATEETDVWLRWRYVPLSLVLIHNTRIRMLSGMHTRADASGSRCCATLHASDTELTQCRCMSAGRMCATVSSAAMCPRVAGAQRQNSRVGAAGARIPQAAAAGGRVSPSQGRGAEEDRYRQMILSEILDHSPQVSWENIAGDFLARMTLCAQLVCVYVCLCVRGLCVCVCKGHLCVCACVCVCVCTQVSRSPNRPYKKQ